MDNMQLFPSFAGQISGQIAFSFISGGQWKIGLELLLSSHSQKNDDYSGVVRDILSVTKRLKRKHTLNCLLT